MQINTTILNLIGRTPLVELHNLKARYGFKARLVAKIESFNPSGSVKDRASFYMLKQALDDQLINDDSHIIEPTSGNTGIGLALACATLRLKLTIVLPDNMSVERRAFMKAYGANLVLTPAADKMAGAIAKAREMAAAEPNTFIPMQFENEANVKAHYETTGPEVYRDTDGLVDIFVSGVGTGGTVTGAGRYLKEQKPGVKIIAVEPAASAVISGNPPGPHIIQGIGPGFVPKVYDPSTVDQVMTATNEDSLEFAKAVCRSDGLFVGISSGAALSVAVKLAQLDENKDKLIVVVLPDSADRYLSTDLFKDAH